MEAFDYKNANVLLTGATGGIGQGYIKALAQRGCANIFVPGSNQNRLDQLNSDFLGANLQPVQVDLTNLQGVDAFIQFIRNTLGESAQLDLVIFNAGTVGLGEGDDFPSWDQASQCLALNILSPEFSFRKMVEAKLLGDKSCVLASGSISGHRSYPMASNISVYSASKAALSLMVKNWARDHNNMTIFELAYGAVDTNLLAQCKPNDMTDEEWDEELAQDIPIGEVVKPEVLGETVIHLLEAPGYRLFHGSAVQINGGEINV